MRAVAAARTQRQCAKGFAGPGFARSFLRTQTPMIFVSLNEKLSGAVMEQPVPCTEADTRARPLQPRNEVPPEVCGCAVGLLALTPCEYFQSTHFQLQ